MPTPPKSKLPLTNKEINEAINLTEDLELSMSNAMNADPVKFFILSPIVLPLWLVIKFLVGILKLAKRTPEE
jgi:hypothetical protein